MGSYRFSVSLVTVFRSFLLGALAFATSASGISEDRNLSSQRSFPKFSATQDAGDILEVYPAYLYFVLEVGKTVNPKEAQLLYNKYRLLRTRDKEAAARFLRLLRFEMVQKIELMGLPPESVTMSTPGMREWVGRFMKEWVREADEQIFRARTNHLITRRE